ncbi:hypothetical protein [Maribacter halichondriae]|uniref:hypothetical protein n=1 Tax=Maribacter halichondriae TaxID=2980554 RepID=UPI0030761D27
MKKMYLAMVSFLMVAIAFSQTTITGTVLDGDNGGPLPGANVLIKEQIAESPPTLMEISVSKSQKNPEPW